MWILPAPGGLNCVGKMGADTIKHAPHMPRDDPPEFSLPGITCRFPTAVVSGAAGSMLPLPEAPAPSPEDLGGLRKRVRGSTAIRAALLPLGCSRAHSWIACGSSAGCGS